MVDNNAFWVHRYRAWNILPIFSEVLSLDILIVSDLFKTKWYAMKSLVTITLIHFNTSTTVRQIKCSLKMLIPNKPYNSVYTNLLTSFNLNMIFKDLSLPTFNDTIVYKIDCLYLWIIVICVILIPNYTHRCYFLVLIFVSSNLPYLAHAIMSHST